MSVTVVGAGAAGLAAAYALYQEGWTDIRILEATANIGGRIKKDNTTWNDMSVDLGAEFIHGDPAVLLPQIVDIGDIAGLTVPFTFDLSVWDGETFYDDTTYTGDWKWADSTWWDFFNENLVPVIGIEQIVFGCQVNQINYENETASITTCVDGRSFSSDYVIVTASMRVLQENKIAFLPPLPQPYLDSLQKFRMEPGLKVFIEFRTKFYPDAFEIESDYATYSWDESSSNYASRFFYDETVGQNTNRNIMGVFIYGRVAEIYLQEPNGDEIVARVLEQLDSIFGGKAASEYVTHTVQVWPNEPNILTAYTRWVDDDPGPIRVFQTPIAKRLLFAGEALPPDLENWGYVHSAALSGREAARKITSGDISAGTGNLVPSKWWKIVCLVVIALL